jgi:hypothetical protein
MIMKNIIQLVPNPRTGEPRKVAPVFFTRAELDAIFNVYARKVSAGEWRDYSFQSSPQSIAFAVYKRSGDVPIFRIEKRPKARRNGPYILSEPGKVVRFGRELKHILAYFQTTKTLKLSH